MLRHLISTALLVGLLSAVGTAALWGSIQLDERTLPGLRIAGEELPPTAAPAADIARSMDSWLDESVTVRAGDHSLVVTRRELGVDVDVATASDHALALGRSGDPARDLADWWAASRGEIDITATAELDRDALTGFVALFEQYVRREASPAHFNFEERVAVPHVDGATLDIETSADVLATAILEGTDAELVVEDLLVPENERLPDGLRLTDVLASWRTRYSDHGRSRSRAHNVELATSRLHGAIIPAGGTLSFNDRVGERTRRAGFRRAKVISGGELVDGMGGGVCQVASTLHAAALHAGFDMVEYRPHSRPSSYIPMAMDATVVFPTQDLKIQNPFDFPVAVYATAAENRLVVELVGASDPREVEIERRVLGRMSFSERVVEDPSLATGTRVVSQEGIRGARVERIRIIRQGDDTFADYDVVRYPPTHRIIRVGTGPAPAVPPPGSAAPLGALALR